MKINSKLKLNIIFWTITAPAVPVVILLLAVAMILSPIPNIGQRMMDWAERTITKFAIWRNNLPVVKKAYDKVHLFDYIKG
jgi:hypothetical protein